MGVKELLFINTKRKEEKFLSFLKDFHLVIDLTALSYMDLPHLSYKKNMVRNLSIFTLRYFCNIQNIPMI